MSSHKQCFLTAWALLLLSAPLPAFTQAPPTEAHSLAELRTGFGNPPATARLRCYWWWLNGNTDEITITHDLEQMKQKGFGGVLLVDANGADQNGNKAVPAGPTFGSPAWVKLYTHALREADRLGLEVTLNITSGWNLGGPDVTPEQASKLLTWTRTTVQGGQHVRIRLENPPARNGFYRQIAVLAYPLQHGEPLAQQPNDRQGDRFTGNESAAVAARQSARTLAFRSAAAETGFSMPDASAMLNPGPDTEYADTPANRVQNVSSQVTPDGTLDWQAPAGEWEILRIGYTNSGSRTCSLPCARVSTSSGAWQGLAIDYMSHEAFDSYWDNTVEPLLQVAKPFHSLVAVAEDSWEVGGANWTAAFREQFQELRGYDPVPWLPVVAGRIVGDRSQSTRFLTDLRRTVADLIVREHYDVFAGRARAHGLGVQAESGGPHGAPIDALETFRQSAVPQTEFWSENPHRNTDPERFFTKEAASAANIYGRPYVAQEGETSIGPQWSESLSTDLKPSFDMAVTEGLNRLVWHQFTSSPASTGLPGQEYFAGTHLNPKVTWWNAGEAFFTYLNRVQFLMQQGTAVNDVLYFYGDNVPNFVRLKADDPAHALPGYDYDVTNEDALLHMLRGDPGQLRGPSGVHWRALALPLTGRLSLPVLALLDTYVAAGGLIIGPPPSSPTGRTSVQQQAQFTATIAKIWGACPAASHHGYGKGQVFCSEDSHAALASAGVLPDVEALKGGTQGAASGSAFDYVHRRTGSADLYFVRNGSAQAVTTAVAFRIDHGTPELWDPVSGTSNRVPAYDLMPDGRTRIQLAMPPFGSAVVVFSEHDDKKLRPVQTSSAVSELVRPVNGWTVTFQAGRGAPKGPIHLDTLTDWARSTDLGIRYFSGTAVYHAKVQAPPRSTNAEISLTFSNLHEIGKVRINGHDAGTVWAKPLRLRVDQFLSSGVNDVEIEVTNLWPNRIIGDLQPGTTRTYTSTNVTSYTDRSPLLPSGLIGPLAWEVEERGNVGGPK